MCNLPDNMCSVHNPCPEHATEAAAWLESWGEQDNSPYGKLRRAALAAYHVLDEQLRGYEEQPPRELLDAHAALFETLDLHQPEPEELNDDLPF